MAKSMRIACGAVTQRGTPCAAGAMPGRSRCRWHGGCSTGPRTLEGKAKVALNLPRVFAAMARSTIT